MKTQNQKRPVIRRVVTGDDTGGKSCIVEDAPAKSIKTVAERPGYCAVNVWRTTECPPEVVIPDSIGHHRGILPPKNGTILRIIDFPPEPKDPVELKRRLDATFGGIYADAQHDKSARHPGMHRTDTIDYALVLEGEIWAVMDRDETLLRAGDVLIQRGTNHAWANRSTKTARIAFVLIDGKR